MADYKKILSNTKEKETKGLFFEQDTELTVSKKTRFELINTKDIDTKNDIKIDQNNIEFIKTHGQIDPVIVIPKIKEEEKFGAKIKTKTGQYSIINGEETVQILNHLHQETKDIKYSVCQCIVLSVDLTEDQQNEIINQLQKEKKETIESIVTKTKGKDITLCYDFEEVRLEPEKLQFEHNAFTYTQEEIQALSDSILRFGMWDLPLILPKIDNKGNISYQIIAGHKRITSVLFIKEKARNKEYEEDNSSILERLQTIKVRLLPVGATEQQIEAVHEYSNLMRRQLTVEQGLEHIHMISSLPSIPNSQKEYERFLESYSMQSLVKITENYFKGLGWNNWKDRKTSRFLTVYYFGCDAIKEAFKDKKFPINQKDLLWIVTTYKTFEERFLQEETLKKALKDPMYLEELKSYSTKRRNTGVLKYDSIYKQLIQQRDLIRKWLANGIETTPEENEKIRATIDELKFEIQKLEANCRIF